MVLALIRIKKSSKEEEKSVDPLMEKEGSVASAHYASFHLIFQTVTFSFFWHKIVQCIESAWQ